MNCTLIKELLFIYTAAEDEMSLISYDSAEEEEEQMEDTLKQLYIRIDQLNMKLFVKSAETPDEYEF